MLTGRPLGAGAGGDRFDQAVLEEVCYLLAANFLFWLCQPPPPRVE